MTKETNERCSLDDATPAQWDAASQAAREEVTHEVAGAPIALRFPAMLRKMWSGTEVQNWLDKQGPLYAHPASIQPKGLTDRDIWQAMGDAGLKWHGIHVAGEKAALIAGVRALLAAEQPSEDKRDAERFRWWVATTIAAVNGDEAALAMLDSIPEPKTLDDLREGIDATMNAAISKGVGHE